jgi:hypothetical protein
MARELARNNLYTIYLRGLVQGKAKSVSLPESTDQMLEYNNGVDQNDTFVNGKTTYSDLEITMYLYRDDTWAQSVLDESRTTDLPLDISIEQKDVDGNVVAEWRGKVKFFALSHGELSSTGDAALMEETLKGKVSDWAKIR